MNRDEPANFKRIETQTMFRLPSATGASLTKPEPPMRAEIRSGCSPIRPQPTFKPNTMSHAKPSAKFNLKINTRGKLYPSRRKRCRGLPKER
jgi:hypothetical protein